METRLLLQLLYLTSIFISTGLQQDLTVNPSRSQFLKGESVSLSCEDGSTVMRNTSRKLMSSCQKGWGDHVGSSCNINFMFMLDNGVYWCESREGMVGNSINITVTETVILQSPVQPVMEGQHITLGCKTRASANHSVAFYKDNILIGATTLIGSAAYMTLPDASRSDEGFYRCNISGVGESPPCWISITGGPSSTEEAPSILTPPPTHGMISVGLVMIVVCHLGVFFPYFISTLLMLSIFRRRTKGTKQAVSMMTSSCPETDQRSEDGSNDVMTRITSEHSV